MIAHHHASATAIVADITSMEILTMVLSGSVRMSCPIVLREFEEVVEGPPGEVEVLTSSNCGNSHSIHDSPRLIEKLVHSPHSIGILTVFAVTTSTWFESHPPGSA